MRDPYGLFPLDVAHYGRLDDYTALVDYIYQSAINESIRLGIRRIGATKEPFSFGLVPETKKRFEQVLKKFITGISATILRGTETEWIKSAEKNDVLVNALFKNSRLTHDQLSEFMDRNLSALETFQKRKVNGMGLSDRVWRLGEQFQQEMEMSIDIGIGDGRSAAQLSRDIRQNLQNPDNLFRRVRDKHGVLQLSKNAAAYHPGQGVYRSSYKNAMRLTRTEINMAYRTADYERYNQLPQIRGIEVVLSNNHPVPDICDDLKGKYPKDFIFRGWHPQCRCHTITILATEADQDKMLDAILSGDDPFSVPVSNPVTSPPKGLSGWLSTNKDRIQNWKSKPYFISDNPGYIKDAMQQAASKPVIVKPAKPKPEPSPKPKTEKPQSRIPAEFLEGGKYTGNSGIKFDNEFFNMLDARKPIKLEVSTRTNGAYFMPSENKVMLGKHVRYLKSDYHKTNVVYHEYGHALDWQRNLKADPKITAIRSDYLQKYRKRRNYTQYDVSYNSVTGSTYKKRTVFASEFEIIDSRLKNLSVKFAKINPEILKKYGTTLDDVREQIGSTADMLMSLNKNFGFGHSKSYMGKYENAMAEFIAHAFEAKFNGNVIFKKLMPDLYDDVIKYIDSLK